MSNASFSSDDDVNFLHDIINKSVQESSKNIKPQKRNKPPTMPGMQDQAMSKLMVDYQAGVKKRKMSQSQSMDVIPQKVQETIAKQIDSRQQCSDLMLNNLSDILTQLDADYKLMNENQEKLEEFAGNLLKCTQQSNAAQKQKLKLLREVHATFNKGCEDIRAVHEQQNEKLTKEMEEDLNIFKQKLIAETKRNLRKAVFTAIHIDD